MSPAVRVSEDVPVTTAEYLARLTGDERWFSGWPYGEPRRGVDAKRLLKRLASERDALLASGEGLPACRLLGPSGVDDALVADWSLQSYPRCERVGGESPAGLSDTDWLFVAAPGARLHPALVTALMLRSRVEPQVSAWSWNEVWTPPGGRPVFVRKPGPSPWALLGADWLGSTLAVTVACWRAAPEEIREAWLDAKPGPMALWLAGRNDRQWQHHPEYLSLRTDARGPAAWSGESSVRSAWVSLAGRLDAQVGWRDLARPADPDLDPPAEPASMPEGVSVVIPFHESIAETLTAVRALAAQRIGTWVEVVLVDNRTSETGRVALRKGLSALDGRLRIRHVDYPHGFNHSRQCNLGVERSAGEVVVILNNDAELLSADTLEQLARWSMPEGVGTVGPRIVGADGNQVCAGIRARLKGGYDFEASFEESRDTLLAGAMREVAGNTGACFAIRRDRFRRLGGFDPVLFPIGFNDVDLACRARAHGLHHLNLGWLSVRHEPGGSRGRSDEVLQKVLLRQRYPDTARFAQFQLGADLHLGPVPTAAGRSPRPARWRESLRRLRAALAARTHPGR